jgi:capsular polysaccharide biosynthesis protein
MLRKGEDVDPIRRGYGYRISWALALPVSTVGIVMGWMLGMVFLPRFLPAEASVMFYGLFGLVPGVGFLIAAAVRSRSIPHSDHSIVERVKSGRKTSGRIDMKVLVVAVVIVAMAVSWGTFFQMPTYKASAHVLVGERAPAQGTGKGKIQLIPLAPTPETLGMLTQTMISAIESRPVAEEVIRRSGLRMDPDELLDNLTVEQVEGTQFIRLTSEDNHPMRARLIANTVGQVSSELISERSSNLTATVWHKAEAPESPVSPHPLRNGFLTLVIGLVLCAGIVGVRPGVRALVASTLGERPSRQVVGIVERVSEKKLLLAIGRRGKLTAVQASLDTRLSAEESRRILEELAFAGHLQVTVEDGKILYSFWGHEAP